MDVFFYEAFEEEAKSLKSLIGNKFTYEMSDKTVQEIGHSAPPARVISIRTQSIIPTAWAQSLDGILSRSTGYDHLKKYLSEIQTPLPCGYLQEYATRAVAEHAILLMMSLLRRLPNQITQFKSFNRDGLTGGECPGRNLLVVGVGRIGSEIAGIGSALGMNVRGVDIVERHTGIRYTGKEEGFAWADVIICSMNLTPENRGYFSYDLLKRTHPGVIFVNIARGEHAPLDILARLMKEQHIGGLGLDVFEDEPHVAVAFRSKHPASGPGARTVKDLLDFPGVLFTPHNAFNTLEAVERKSQFSVDALVYFLKKKDFQTRIR